MYLKAYELNKLPFYYFLFCLDYLRLMIHGLWVLLYNWQHSKVRLWSLVTVHFAALFSFFLPLPISTHGFLPDTKPFNLLGTNTNHLVSWVRDVDRFHQEFHSSCLKHASKRPPMKQHRPSAYYTCLMILTKWTPVYWFETCHKKMHFLWTKCSFVCLFVSIPHLKSWGELTWCPLRRVACISNIQNMKIAADLQPGHWSTECQLDSKWYKWSHVVTMWLLWTSILLYCISSFLWRSVIFRAKKKKRLPQTKNGDYTCRGCAQSRKRIWD